MFLSRVFLFLGFLPLEQKKPDYKQQQDMQDGALLSSKGAVVKCVTWVAIFKDQLETECNYTKNQMLDMLNTSETC